MRIVILLVIGLLSFPALSAELPFFSADDLTPYWSFESKNKSPATVTAFRAQDQNGQSLSAADLKGHLTLVNFFFAQCPSLCPTMMQTLHEFERRHSGIQLLSFSVRPDQDGPAQLKAYFRSRHLNPKTWRLVTGAKDVIYRVGREVFKADGTAADSPASFTHTRNVYLVDQAGRVRGIYDTGSATAMADLAKDIERLR